MQRHIGSGTFGQIYEAIGPDGIKVAIKDFIFPFDEGRINSSTVAEITALKMLDHPNIVSISGSIIEGKRLWMIMELGDKSLDRVIESKPLELKLIKKYMRDLVLGLLHCHRNYIVHRDIKPDNILLINGTLKLSDFGASQSIRDLSTSAETDKTTGNVGTMWYRPPELFFEDRTTWFGLDVWSLGCVFAEMITGEVLFKGTCDIEQICKIFKVLGTPTEKLYPGCMKLPNLPRLRLIWPYSGFSELHGLDQNSLDLLSRMVSYKPFRIRSSELPSHPYFA